VFDDVDVDCALGAFQLEAELIASLRRSRRF
jgi:hypothetical protein